MLHCVDMVFFLMCSPIPQGLSQTPRQFYGPETRGRYLGEPVPMAVSRLGNYVSIPYFIIYKLPGAESPNGGAGDPSGGASEVKSPRRSNRSAEPLPVALESLGGACDIPLDKISSMSFYNRIETHV